MNMTPAERKTRITEVARANPGSALADLAQACSRSPRWTAQVLREAGVVFFEAPETQKPTPPRSPRSIKASTTRLVKKLIAEARSLGCVFERSAGIAVGGSSFFQVVCPDDATRERFEPLIRQHAVRIFDVLYPPAPRYRKKRACLICKAGSGCRKRGLGPGHELVCPACRHTCRSHYPAEVSYYKHVTPGGCYAFTQPTDDVEMKFACLCKGWPEAAPAPAQEQEQMEGGGN